MKIALAAVVAVAVACWTGQIVNPDMTFYGCPVGTIGTVVGTLGSLGVIAAVAKYRGSREGLSASEYADQWLERKVARYRDRDIIG